jgi:hypothetical protein
MASPFDGAACSAGYILRLAAAEIQLNRAMIFRATHKPDE